MSFFPVLSWLPSYPWKQDLIPDILAGLTVGIMSIPQGKCPQSEGEGHRVRVTG